MSMFDSFRGFVGDTVQGIKSGIENLSEARYKTGEALSTERQEELLDKIRLEEKQKYLDQGYSEEDAFELANQAAREKVQKLVDIIKSYFDLTPFGIKSFLKLDRPIYAETASYGHFGREYDESKGTFTWESLSSVDLFKTNF